MTARSGEIVTTDEALPPAIGNEAGPLSTPQTARTRISIADRVILDAEVKATPLGLLAIGGLVTAILLSVPPIIRAARERER
ncbi:hypothetical protein G7077_06515 [Sphingomonas piscis]|uniref:Uncharacterized protein n=1 Tax=Sphingomonas piscis TaxID=2714943 RepID=A0A6G7YPE0_9SPHN|nr:hypothetical protein [Sphingomonas piscis]QIK78597.1 hypothetical protein G7077_06515 [Sphingomonas piscis]